MDCRVVAQSGHLIVTIGSRCGACCRLTPHRPPGPKDRPMVNIQDLIDDAKCYETVRSMRWPDGVSCPHCSSAAVTKDGRDATRPNRQRYHCHACRRRFNVKQATIGPLTDCNCSRAESDKRTEGIEPRSYFPDASVDPTNGT